jgi:predicted nucleotidyltransferase
MAEKPDTINSCLIQFCKAVKDRYPILKIFLYGSYAKGKQTPDSDIDIGVVIDDTDHSRRIEITADLFRLARNINNAIEPKCIFRDEFENPEHASILSEIIRSGIDISTLSA